MSIKVRRGIALALVGAGALTTLGFTAPVSAQANLPRYCDWRPVNDHASITWEDGSAAVLSKDKLVWGPDGGYRKNVYVYADDRSGTMLSADLVEVRCES